MRVVEERGWEPPQLPPDLMALAAAARDSLQTHLEPIEPESLGVAVAKLLAHQWRGRADNSSDMAQTALIIDWIEDLQEFPAWAVRKAIREWRRAESWRPTIADIRSLCSDAVEDDRRALRLLNKLLSSQRHQVPGPADSLANV